MNWDQIPRTDKDVEDAVAMLRAELPEPEYPTERLRAQVEDLRRYKIPLYKPWTPEEMATRDWG